MDKKSDSLFAEKILSNQTQEDFSHQLVKVPITSKISFKKQKLTFILLGIFAILFVGAGGFFIGRSVSKPKTAPSAPIEAQTTPLPTQVDETANWKTYTNDKYLLTFRYPANLNLDSSATKDLGKMIIISFKSTDKSSYLSIERALSFSDLISGHGLEGMNKINVQNLDINSEKVEVTTWETNIESEFYNQEDPVNTLYTSRFLEKPLGVDYNLPKVNATLETFTQILSTFKFTDQEITPIPTSTPSAKTITYKLPEDWTEVTDKSNIFSVGYDPLIHTVTTLEERIDLNSVQAGNSYFLKVLSYDEGSKREFIRININASSLEALETAKTTEINYSVSGNPGLFFYNMDLSGSCSIGMVTINSSKALLIESQTCNQQAIEQELATLKFLD